ncbi:MAG: cyclic nucleotide-binding domain-containing protein [Candidatus Neomarinimicrobiota bacterium]
MSDLKDLAQFRIFRHLTEDQLNTFRQAVRIKKYPADDLIFQEGEVGDSIYLLLDGKVEINQALTLQLSKGSYDTREKAIINLTSDMHPVFGEMSLLGDDDRRTATVKAMTVCSMAVIMKKDLFSICESDPLLGYQVMKNVANIVTDNLVKANQNVLKLTTAFSLVLEK